MFSGMKRLPFKRIGTGVILFGLLCLTFYIRIQGVERIPDGQFTENDAYLFHRQANIIAEQGALPARDMDRWLPLGRDNTQLLSLYPYAIAALHKVFPWWSLYQIQLYLPVLCFTLALGVLFLFFTRCYGVMFASIMGVLLATLPGSISRSAAGFGDRDAWYYLIGVLVTTSCSGAGETCSGGWDPPGCGAPNYPCESSHSTTHTCEDCGTTYRECVGHTCEDNDIVNKRNHFPVFEWLGNEIDELFRTRKTFWFGGMALSLTISVLGDVLWDSSEYLHLLTPPFTIIYLSYVGFRIAPILIFGCLYLRERRRNQNRRGDNNV